MLRYTFDTQPSPIDVAGVDNTALTNHPDWVSLLLTVEDRLDQGQSCLISRIERKCLDDMHRCQGLDGWQYLTLSQIARRIGVRP